MILVNQDSLDIKEDPQVNEEILKEKEHEKRRKQLIVLIAVVVVCIIIVVIVVPVVVLMHHNHGNVDNQVTIPSKGNSNNSTLDPQSAMTQFYTSSQKCSQPPAYAHAASPYANLTLVKVLEPASSVRRVFVMGDIHGCLSEMNQLLAQIQFNASQDIMILTGDLVYRGEDSMGVIQRAQQIGAYCVRGNHDDKVIRLKGYELKNGPMNTFSDDIMDEGSVVDPIKFSNKHSPLAKEMNVDEYNYLTGCPLIIDIPDLKARVVHGGLDPFVTNLVDNDPWSVLNMRGIDGSNQPSKLKTSTADVSLENWTQVYQRHNPNNITVFYGHDASRGLAIQDTTVGLDSGCVHGRQLSVMEIKTRKLTQVNCKLRGDAADSTND